MKTRDENRKPEPSEALSPHRIAQLREAGMHAIRFEFVVRLLRVEVKMDTMTIYWDHDSQELMNARPGDARWRLVAGRGRRAAAEFSDNWVLRYPGDPVARRETDAEIDRLVESLRVQHSALPRSTPAHAAAISQIPGGGV